MTDAYQKINESLTAFTTELLKEHTNCSFKLKSYVEEGDANQNNAIIVNSNASVFIPGSLSIEGNVVNYVNQQWGKELEGRFSQINLIFEDAIPLNDSQKKSTQSSTKSTKKTAETSESQHSTSFLCTQPLHDLKEVVLSDEKAKEILNAISLIENHALIYEDWGWKDKEPAVKTVLCFYGEPGTGKTMCAHGVAKYLNKKILIASYAEIQSEYVGVGPKNLKAVFEKAEQEDAVLFFDEADSFLRKRTSDTSNAAAMHYNSMTNEMMKHLEDFSGLVIFATNLTENTDEAFKTRITCSIRFVSPDEASRAKIISKMIPEGVPLEAPFSEDDYVTIAQSCEGFVGRDIRNAVKSVLTEGAREKQYPFTLDSFVSGFKHYKENKDSFADSITGEKKSTISPLDTFTENGRILSLLTYAAWRNHNETDEETLVLKEKAKLLGKNKLVINKLSDLDSLEEICQSITHDTMKKNALIHLVDVLVVSDDRDSNMEFLRTVINELKVSEDTMPQLQTLYNLAVQRKEIEKGINIEQVQGQEE